MNGAMYVPLYTHLRTVKLTEQQEEVYFFRSDPRENGATVILTVDTNSFEGKYQKSLPEPHLSRQVVKAT